MRAGGLKTFWISFFLTLAVLAPLMAATLLWVQVREERAERAAHSKSGVAVQLPTVHHRHTILAAVAGDTPAFVLVRLDATENRVVLAVIPAEGVVLADGQPVTLAESYRAAGPARAANLLRATLGVEIDDYLAITPSSLGQALGDADHLRAGLTGALTAAQLQALGLSAEASDWTAESGHRLLAGLQQQIGQQGITGQTVARARAELWGAAFRQRLEKLPAALPAGLRQVSAATLTSLSAQQYYTLGETLEFLANGEAEILAQVLPGSWNAAAGRYEFSDETLGWLQTDFSSAASSPARAESSVP